ncbi:MAG: hypothetical protein ACO28P_04885, partial [Ilumatobacteraceae bacterium]
MDWSIPYPIAFESIPTTQHSSTSLADENAVAASRQVRDLRQRSAERHVHPHGPVHGPSIRVEDRSEIALAQLEPCDRHRRQR